jgi:hypothetical protein
MTGDLHETSLAIGNLQASVERLEGAVERLTDRIEELQKARWVAIGGLIVSGLSGLGGGWLSKLLHIGG